jgi:hypothetical protein
MQVRGPRYCGPGWLNVGVGFRRRAPGCPPPYLHKCRTTLWRPTVRCGKTAVPSWNSRVAGRDGHRSLHSKVYIHLCFSANPTSNWMVFRCVIGPAVPGLFQVSDLKHAEHARLSWRYRARWCSGWAGAGTKVHGERPSWVVSSIPLQGALAMCAFGTASMRLKQCQTTERPPGCTNPLLSARMGTPDCRMHWCKCANGWTAKVKRAVSSIRLVGLAEPIPGSLTGRCRDREPAMFRVEEDAVGFAASRTPDNIQAH